MTHEDIWAELFDIGFQREVSHAGKRNWYNKSRETEKPGQVMQRVVYHCPSGHNKREV